MGEFLRERAGGGAGVGAWAAGGGRAWRRGRRGQQAQRETSLGRREMGPAQRGGARRRERRGRQAQGGTLIKQWGGGAGAAEWGGAGRSRRVPEAGEAGPGRSWDGPSMGRRESEVDRVERGGAGRSRRGRGRLRGPAGYLVLSQVEVA